MKRAVFTFAIVLLAQLAAFGCAPAAGGAPPAGDAMGASAGASRDVAAIHRSRCGACHVRVEPGERTRAQFADALSRHHGRVKMSDEEWRLMIDYLAHDGQTTAKQ